MTAEQRKAIETMRQLCDDILTKGLDATTDVNREVDKKNDLDIDVVTTFDSGDWVRIEAVADCIMFTYWHSTD